MKKQNSIWIAFLAVAALLMVTTGVVFASSLLHDTPPVNPDGEGSPGTYEDEYEHWGPMHSRGFGRRQTETGYSSMMSEVIDAVSAQTDLTVEQIEGRLAEDEHLYDIALDAGLDETAFFDLMSEVRKDYLEEAVEDGWMTEEQYQWMIDRMGSPSVGNGGEFPCHPQTGDYSPMFNGSQRGFGRRW